MLKEEFHTNYKKYRNYDRYFERNWNNIKGLILLILKLRKKV